jgi:hypothetical protein
MTKIASKESERDTHRPRLRAKSEEQEKIVEDRWSKKIS